MKPLTTKTWAALSACTVALAWPVLVAAEDIDIFTGVAGGTSANPRILVVLDNTSNWSRQSQQWPGGAQQGQSEANAIKTVLNSSLVDGNVNLGLMEFVTGGNANDDGGFIRSAVKPMTVANKATFTTQLTTIYDNVTDPSEKHNANTPYGNLMSDVYHYFSGGTSYSPGGVIASKADASGYTTAYTHFASPLSSTEACGKNFVIFIGNPNSSGPTVDSAANRTALANAGGSTAQLYLPNISSQNITSLSTLGTTAACYANATAAVAGLASYSAQCAAFTDGCTIGAAGTPTGPVSCAPGTAAYTVIQAIFTPAAGGGGVPVLGTPVPSGGVTTGFYADAASVNPTTDHGSLTCPAPVVNGGDTTTYSCTYSVGTALPAAVFTPSSHTATSNGGCYKGVSANPSATYWDPSLADHGGLVCPANASCTYSGTASASGCAGSNKLITVTQNGTYRQQFNVTQIATPSTASSNQIPAHTTYNTLGATAQCYGAGPAVTNDYASSCTGTNISCTYNNMPTSSTVAACPSGTSVYDVVGKNVALTDVATGGSTLDTATYNADEWARFMHDVGVPLTDSTILPSVTTYTIDVYHAQPNPTHSALLMSMAKAGGGKYFTATNEQGIIDALRQILIEIQAVNSAFAATSLPVNATNRSQSENQVFIGMFRPDPDAKPGWYGNLKRYKLIQHNGDIVLGDSAGQEALNGQTGFFTPCAVSYWTADQGAYWTNVGLNYDTHSLCDDASKWKDSPDGPLVEKGGVAQILRQGNSATGTGGYAVNRNMYTYSSGALTAFDTGSSGLSASVVNFIKGYDVNNERNLSDGSNLTTTRPSIHGDVVHSRPLPVNYGDNENVTVYYGGNDGALHSINAGTGQERWSFVAPEFYPYLSRLQTQSPLVNYPNLAGSITPAPQSKNYFFDGSTGLYQNSGTGADSKIWIYPTMRRGGRMLYSLDVTSQSTPVFKWRAGCPNLSNDTGCTDGMSGIGQTWSTPVVAFIKGYSSTTPVVLVGGGYDSCEDANSTTPSCGAAKGGIVYILDADTGALLRSFPTTRPVAGDISLIDVDGDGMPDYAYAADTGGNIYRMDFITGPVSRTAMVKDDWVSHRVAYTNGGGRKFLFAPATLSVKSIAYLALGSGDREHPLQSQYPYDNVLNRFYVYKDDLTSTITTEAVNLDTALENYTTSSTCNTPSATPASPLKGWYMNLNQYGQGEQVVGTALIVSGTVTFNTNRPVPPSSATCSTTRGEARGYWLDLFNASGGIGVDDTCGGSRSSIFAGGGMAPSAVLARSVLVAGAGPNDPPVTTTVIIGAPPTSGAPAVPNQGQEKKVKTNSTRKRTYSYTTGR